MRLNQLRDFLAVAQTGSLRAAARTVGVSQPAITKSIRQLEEELQVQLLQRNARGAVTTPAGKVFLARARVVQTELRKAKDDLARLRGEHGGTVAFGVAPAACMLIVPEALVRFQRRQPHARTRIVEGVNTALLPLVRDETLDFSIGMKSAAKLDPGIKFKPLFRPQVVVAGRRGHPLRAAKSLRELAEASWLMFNPLGVGGMLERTFSAAGLTMPRTIIQCESYAAALALLAKTDTLGLLVPQILAEPYAHRLLQQIEVGETIYAPVIGLYTRAGAPLTPAASAMAKAVSAAARRLARSSIQSA